MSYIVGNYIRISATFTGPSGAPADPSTVTARVRCSAGGEVTINPIIRDGIGQFHFDVLAEKPGNYFWRVEAAGNVVAATEGSFIALMPNADWTASTTESVDVDPSTTVLTWDSSSLTWETPGATW